MLNRQIQYVTSEVGISPIRPVQRNSYVLEHQRIGLRGFSPSIDPGRLLSAMGWQGGHMHEFIINDMHYGEPDPDYPEPDLKNEQRVRLEKVLGGARTFDYIYDSGDAWWHHVTLLERTQFEGPLDSPWCLEGANACPLEDVGGIPGYEDFLQIMASPSHPEYAQVVQWCGGPFDPSAFDLDEVNQRLMEVQL